MASAAAALLVLAPLGAGAAAAAFQTLHTVAVFEPIGRARTRLTLTQPGYRPEPAYDGVYRFFREGNRYSLEQLKSSLQRAARAN